MEQYDVVVQTDSSQRSTPDDFGRLFVRDRSDTMSLRPILMTTGVMVLGAVLWRWPVEQRALKAGSKSDSGNHLAPSTS